MALVLGHRAIILVFTLFATFPFYWMVVTAFEQNADLDVGATDISHNPFKSLPKEVEESAMVDGCSRLGAIRRMVLPLSLPGVLTAVIFIAGFTVGAIK